MRISSVPPTFCLLSSWNIAVNKNNGEEHFIGFDENSQRERLSTPIKFFDEITGVGSTYSGSRYKVIGKPSKPDETAIILYKVNLNRGNLLVGSEFEWKYPFSDDSTVH